MKGQPLAKRKARKARNNTAPSSLLTLMTEGKHMSSLHKLKVADLETIDHLREWVDERLYGSVVVIDTNGEVVIRTGMGIDLGNYLYPLNEEE